MVVRLRSKHLKSKLLTENTSKPQLDTESIVWDREHTVSATKFLWFDKNNNLEVAQYWQNHMRWAVAKFNRTYKDEIFNITPHGRVIIRTS